MKKLILGALVVLGAALALLLAEPVQAQSRNNFTISSYDVAMTLSRDGDRRSRLVVEERITAEFPQTDQNHGLERAFVKEYDGHGVSFRLERVTNEAGDALQHHWEGDNLRIGDPDVYVHGAQTYVIAYSMRDVTKFFASNGRDELYWDVFGTDWRVPIEAARVTLEVDEGLRGALSGHQTCYQGAQRSTTTCQVEETAEGFAVSAASLRPREGLTLAVGFAEGTFAGYQRSLWEWLFIVWVIVQIVVAPLAVVVGVWFYVLWRRRLERTRELGTIVPEYLPPPEASVTISSRISGHRTSATTAQLIDLAVRHYVKIYETKAKATFSPAQYEIEIVRDPTALRQEEQELLRDMFGVQPAVGARLDLKTLRHSTAYYTRTLNNDTMFDDLLRGDYALRAHDESLQKWARRWAKAAVVVAVVSLSLIWVFVAIVIYSVSAKPWRLSDKGLALRRYLEGLKLYIGVAEEARLKMMQSPEGAEKIHSVVRGDPASDPKLLIKLYERVLPYAVLFGQEKQWNAQLGKYYETAHSQPDWYAGQTAFNAAVFSSAMSGFSTASSSYVSSDSSSSGGSGGGGFSGGGGGGGGGGGW